ncbi:MAG: c-type cytochrome [Nannocystaceae bacterium]
MSTTLSMWLGIAFLVLAIVAVLLQAWLWGPKFWDDEAKKTRAPRSWLRVHAFAGYAYGVIYAVMMWHMLPRLWEYQYELPARTVIHAVLAIAIGVLLITKIMILLFFRHFEEAMPRYGFGILICTVAMITLSVPFAIRAHDLEGRTADPENIERVRKALADVDGGLGIDLDKVVTEAGFDRGRQVLVGKCITCHDMRTILAKPRTAKGWMSVNERMLEKPAVFGDALDPEDVPYVTAYLVAITPDIQRSAKSRREDAREKEARADALLEAIHDADTVLEVDKQAGEALLQAKCLDCHEMEETEAHGGDDASGWRSVIAAMVDEGAELTEEEINLLAAYLEVKFPKSAETKAAEAKKDAENEAAAEAEAKKQAEEEAAEEASDEAEAEEDEEEAPKPKPKKAKPQPKGDRKAGKAVYMQKCKACHGDDGKGDTIFGSKINVASLSRTRLSFSKVRQITAKGVSGTKMKGYEGKLSDDDLDNVAAFVKSLR